MTELQKFCDTLLFGEDTFDHKRSNLLVEILNAIGFSKMSEKYTDMTYISGMHL
jgi:hypothetical protein